MKRRIAFMLAWVTLAVPAYCATNTFTVTGSVAITDDGYNGATTSMASMNLVVPTIGPGVVQKVTVQMALAHTWVGDLVIKVQSPAATLITLMSMPGIMEAADNGTSPAGDSSNFSALFPILFEDGGPKSAELMGNTIASAGIVCQDDLACVYDPNAGAATPGKLAAFIGQSMTGTWKLCVGDAGLGDVGTLNEFILTIVTEDPPVMQIARSGTNVTFTWPTNSLGYTLQSNQPLQTNGWATVSGSPSISGTNFLVTVPATNSASFFRLRK